MVDTGLRLASIEPARVTVKVPVTAPGLTLYPALALALALALTLTLGELVQAAHRSRALPPRRSRLS